LSDRFSILPADKLLKWIFEEEKTGQIFGITDNMFFRPREDDVFKMKRYGKTLDTPIGVAAGPHTQLAQNIITAYLTGSRYIELKTVQTLDELYVSKPCIDMEDEGYNCEWSQELKLRQSFDQYLTAWIIIHVLNHKFNFGEDINCIFNMSVGYNMEGILKENVQEFLALMNDAKEEKEKKLNQLEKIYPQLKNVNIPDRISDNVTLSTMHGCPQDEIEKIAKYLIEKKKLHTAVKLNPTLLGYKELNTLLKKNLGYDTVVPPEAFEHDLKYEDAVNIINSLQRTAAENNVEFSIKLTNTLESVNNKTIFPAKEKMMYMSGRALHPIGIAVAQKLQNDFNNELDVSFSAGTDCFNISEILACGIKPVTVCSDLLKPGGYARQIQYLENIKSEFKTAGAKTINEFIIKKNPEKTDYVKLASLNNLNIYAEVLKHDKYYMKSFLAGTTIKTERELKDFDCIKAPCVYTCPDSQDIPDYMYYTSKGEFDKAYEVIIRNNPFPNVTGMICDHQCQTKCTRINYDNSLLIREVKRFVAENAKEKNPEVKKKNGKKVFIIGGGPSGLSAAYFLALEGFEVEIFDSKKSAGGMVSDVIPEFRLSKEALNKDIKRIENLGVKISYDKKINDEDINKLKDNLNDDFLYIGVGAQKSKKMNIKGENDNRVLDALNFLSDVKKNNKFEFGKNIAVIGGGNTAIDTARTAKRIAGENGKVTLIYRRTRKEMPADKDEIKSMLDEGIELLELTAPDEIIQEEKKLKLICHKMELSGKDESGRAKPVIIEGSEFVMHFDYIIPAIGQEVASEFLGSLKVNPYTFETQYENVYLGGDALRGASTLIKAIADGKNAAYDIITKSGGNPQSANIEINKNLSNKDFQKKNAVRVFGESVIETFVYERNNFEIVTKFLTTEAAIKESSRCLYCDTLCNVCVTVCPNRANISFEINPAEYRFKNILIEKGEVKLSDDLMFKISQPHQVLNIQDFCNECGNCTTFCPTSGAPYIDKPRLFLNENDLMKNGNEGYYVFTKNGNRSIKYKNGLDMEMLTLFKDYCLYESGIIEIKFAKNNFKNPEVKIKDNFEGAIDLMNTIKMNILLENLPDYLFT
jgi:putative selenate reductase